MIITLLRKPLEGTLADNTLKHGCGGINIDATRVGTDEIKQADKEIKGGFWKSQGGSGERWNGNGTSHKLGRWPANFTLTHLEGCELVGNEEVETWACVEGCPIKILDEQSGFQKSGVAGSKSRAWGVAGKGQLSSTEEGVGWKAYGSEGYGDEGGASRFFMQFKKDPEE